MKVVSKIIQGLLLILIILLHLPTASGQQVQATLQGRVVDELGGLIVGAAVSVLVLILTTPGITNG